MPEFLLLVDCDQIQSYVFGTHRLREIGNASALATRINESLDAVCTGAPGVTIKQPLASTAGVYKAVVEAGDLGKAESAAASVAREFTTRTGAITATWHVEPLNGSFAASLQAGERTLREKKRMRTWAPTFPSHPLFRLCALCGQNPAEHSFPRPGDGAPELLCDVCYKKAANDRRQPGQGGVLKKVADEVRDGIVATLAEAGTTSFEVDFPHDFGGIASRRERTEDREAEGKEYLALVYADGNRMGEMWEGFSGTGEEYHALSQAICTATQEALTAAAVGTFRQFLTRELELSDGEHLWVPFVPLMIGGDDVICMTAASWGLPLALRFCKEFSTRLWAHDAPSGVQLTRHGMAVGVTIVRAGFPIQHSLEMARQLLRNAKRLDRELVGADPGAGDPSVVDFEVVHDSSLRAIESSRKDFFRDPHDGNGTNMLTERPYVVEEAGDRRTVCCLLRAVDEVRTGFPRGKLKQMKELLRGPSAEAREEGYAEFCHGLTEEQREKWRRMLGFLGIPDGKWLRENEGRSGILDVVELVDHVGGEG